MDNRRAALRSHDMCRFCLTQDKTALTSLYDKSRTQKNIVSLPLQILSCMSIDIFPSDGLSLLICDRCRFFMDTFYRFKQICRTADEAVLKHIHHGDPIVPMTWPSKLSKMYRNAVNPPKKEKTKTMISETGATIQVTASNEQSDTDDDDENDEGVYKIKIGEDNNYQDAACIKVVKSGDKLHITREESKQKKGTTNTVTKTVPEQQYPCQYCDKIFSKSHQYTRHIRAKHKEMRRTARGPFGECEAYRCDQCDDAFVTQDELIYHSAKHATENLICPLCQEKFNHVEEVSTHIKTHVEGAEFMCDLCELVFTSKEKLDKHLIDKHEEELRQEQELSLEEESMEVEEEEEEEDDDDDANIKVKEENGEMIVEIKKPSEFMKIENDENMEDSVQSEESECETIYTELSTAGAVSIAVSPGTGGAAAAAERPVKTPVIVHKPAPQAALPEPAVTQTASIIKKAAEIKRKSIPKPQEPVAVTDKQVPKPVIVKAQNVAPTPAAPAPAPAAPAPAATADKSLKLLEKELQELKRTNSRNEPAKTAAKSMEAMRGRRAPIHTSTPKPTRVAEEKKFQNVKTPATDKKLPERRTVVTKENKEPKEVKGNSNTGKEDKDSSTKDKDCSVKEKDSIKEKETVAKDKDTETKEKDTPKVVKNGARERNSTEDSVRRSSRSSKVKDYAQMIKSKTGVSSDDSTDDDEEYKETPTRTENRGRPKKVPAPKQQKQVASPARPMPALSASPPAADAASPRGAYSISAAKKRGRPRKGALPDPVPSKVIKTNSEDKTYSNDSKVKTEEVSKESHETPEAQTTAETPEKCPEKPGVIMSPTGQPLKKVPIKAIPPGVKPLPLPMNARPVGPGELCEMQIGKKMMKVQKIVMTKAEVEAMTKKGLVEMKDGTMVLKPGIKLPASEASKMSAAVVKETSQETPSPKEKATPTRCEIDEA